jgi:class 3 adenylate cyclase
LVTLVFTDLVGSTALKQRLGDQAGAQLIAQEQAVVRATLQELSDGEELSTTGDSFFQVVATPPISPRSKNG